ncbi:MAG: glutamine-hydrolyzing carbamoyl-phosphate synthase small subunit [Gemmataceae bacterium]|nr:glutamine-hydrolyzing carbamoyl-phosphate synthase small subunit [Gemmataceae bacterium]
MVEEKITEVIDIAKLALEDGTVYTGTAFGARTTTAGEAVFNTSMAGYQEVLTDPSYTGQIVCMTYPHIGNYGINDADRESGHPRVEGFVVRSLSRTPSNYRSTQSINDYLVATGVPGIEGIDTRSLVRRLRVRGAMRAVISTEILDDSELIRRARAARDMSGLDLVREVVPSQSSQWREGLDAPLTAHIFKPVLPRKRVVALDYGLKWNILRCLTAVGCDVTVVPGTATAADVLSLEPDGVFLSNGPGDPEPLDYAVETIRELIDRKPVFGICLGLQLLGLAFGAKTFKLKFGHRGVNQPVLNKRTGRVEITSQNHGFAVDADTLPGNVELTHVNLNDGTLEGLRHRTKPVFGVQYHPESSAGPHDSTYLFEEFRQVMG